MLLYPHNSAIEASLFNIVHILCRYTILCAYESATSEEREVIEDFFLRLLTIIMAQNGQNLIWFYLFYNGRLDWAGWLVIQSEGSIHNRLIKSKTFWDFYTFLAKSFPKYFFLFGWTFAVLFKNLVTSLGWFLYFCIFSKWTMTRLFKKIF